MKKKKKVHFQLKARIFSCLMKTCAVHFIHFQINKNVLIIWIINAFRIYSFICSTRIEERNQKYQPLDEVH